MGSSTTANSWDQRIESLKSRERQPRIEPPSSVKKDFKASNLMTTELYMSIRSDMPNNFVAELEGLRGREGSVHVSDIAEQVTRGGNTMLHLAAKNGSVDVLQLIVNHFPQLIIRTNITGDTALHFAARIDKDIELTRIILNSYAAQFHNNEEKNLLRIKNEFGNTALHEAVRTQDLEIARLIFEADKHVANYLNNEGKSPLYLAVETKQDGTIDLLLEAALQSQESYQGTSPLHAAIMVMCPGRKRKHRFKPLLQRLETDKSSNFESSPSRTYDFSESYTSFLKLNLAARTTLNSQPKVQGTGAQPNASTTRTRTNGWGRIIKDKFQSLVEGWKKDKTTDVEPSPTRTEINWCEKILEKSPELAFLKDQKGRTALHLAAAMGNVEGVRTILKACPLSALEWDLKGYLPIHIACKKGDVKVVREFVQKQEPWFDPMELLNQKGQNMLHIAAKSGKDRLVEYVLSEEKLEKLLNEGDKNGNTPLHLASKYLHPKIIQLLRQTKRLKVKLVNNKGMTARDIAMPQRSTPPTLREFLSLALLKSIGTPLGEKGRRIRRSHAEPSRIKWIKDRVSTILVVAILVATVTFTAGFTVPGGVYNSDDKDTEKRGMATLLNRRMFQVFTICDAIAMYSSTMGSSILIWAHLGDFHMASSATYFAFYLVGLALITMSIAFMAALHLAVRNVSWLADTVIAIGVIFLLMLLGVFILLIFPLGEQGLFLGHISDFIFKIIIPFSGSYGKLTRKVKVKEIEALEETKKEEDNGEDQKIRTEKLVRLHTV